MSRETIRPAPDDARASGVFSQRLRQHVLVEREIGHQALQPSVFVLELPQAAELAHAQVRVLLLPAVEGGLTDPQLPADVPDRGTALGLAQSVGHLLFGEFRALHRSHPFWVDRRRRHFTLVLGCRCFRGGRQPPPARRPTALRSRARRTAQRAEDELRAAGMVVINLTRALQLAAVSGLERHEYVYWRDDTHWNERGVAIAAAEI